MPRMTLRHVKQAARTFACTHRGFTLIELLIVIAIIAIIAAVALPSYQSQVRKSRRADAIARIAQVQHAQERWRANNATYTTAMSTAPPAGLGIAATTAGGYYTLSVAGPANPASAPFAYDVIAQASGAQASDTNCAFLRSRYENGAITLASGPSSAFGNSEAANRRCWNR
jgi:type IV pilus assembly protein PilE